MGDEMALSAAQRAALKVLLDDEEAIEEAEEEGAIEEVEAGDDVQPGEVITLGGKKYRVVEMPDEIEEEVEAPKAVKKTAVKKSVPAKKAVVRKKAPVLVEDEEVEEEAAADPEPGPTRKRYLS